jgi:hypothetical protein
MLGFKGKYGFSFSWKRLLGISGIKNSVARKTGIPTTRGGMERKIGRSLIRMIFGKG